MEQDRDVWVRLMLPASLWLWLKERARRAGMSRAAYIRSTFIHERDQETTDANITHRT